jgi:5,5'-dehydrodivanillate O-demethylase
MLSVQENEKLTRVGPGTPVGQLFRRYWHPIAASAMLQEEPVKAIRLLGEDLVLYKDRSGTLGLIGQACAHRRVNLLYGIPEPHGLRCPYHGWLYNEQGQCLEQPAEAPDSTFKERIKLPAYPVQELGGLIWAYLGPEPAPLLPRWDLFVWDNVLRQAGFSVIPANWLQIVENALDPVHLEWLHGRFMQHVTERKGASAFGVTRAYVRHHLKIGFDLFEYGVIKRRMLEGQTEEDDDWKIGHPQLFPLVLRVGTAGQQTFQIRVPVDDTHTMQIYYTCFVPPPGVKAPPQEVMPYYSQPILGEDGKHIVDNANNQDIMVWVQQGPIAERNLERLAESDKGIILFRRLLKEQLAIVEDGGDPMCVFRDAAKNVCVTLPQEQDKYNQGRLPKDSYVASANVFGPVRGLVEQMMAGAPRG